MVGHPCLGEKTRSSSSQYGTQTPPLCMPTEINVRKMAYVFAFAADLSNLTVVSKSSQAEAKHMHYFLQPYKQSTA